MKYTKNKIAVTDRITCNKNCEFALTCRADKVFITNNSIDEDNFGGIDMENAHCDNWRQSCYPIIREPTAEEILLFIVRIKDEKKREELKKLLKRRL